MNNKVEIINKIKELIELQKITLNKYHDLHQIDKLSGEGFQLLLKIENIKGQIEILNWICTDQCNHNFVEITKYGDENKSYICTICNELTGRDIYYKLKPIKPQGYKPRTLNS